MVTVQAPLPGVLLGPDTRLSGALHGAVLSAGTTVSLTFRAVGGDGLVLALEGVSGTAVRIAAGGLVLRCGGLAAGVGAGRLHHLAWTWDGVEAVLYLDGREQGRESRRAWPGGEVRALLGPWSGRYYRATVFNRALAPAEVRNLHASGVPDQDRWGAGDRPGAVADWDFSWGVGRHVPDRSSNRAALEADGPVAHTLPQSSGLRTACCRVDLSRMPQRVLQLPPHCAVMGVEVEALAGVGRIALGTEGDPEAFAAGHVPTGTSYFPSYSLACIATDVHIPVLVSGPAREGEALVRTTFEIRGVPALPEFAWAEPSPPDQRAADPAFTL